MSLGELLFCLDFAAKKHKDQRRSDPEETPYINHPIGVAHSLSHEGKVEDINVLKAAILHDTVEDTDTTIAEVEQVLILRFGQFVHADLLVRSVLHSDSDNRCSERWWLVSSRK